jgi:hypothetical protein
MAGAGGTGGTTFVAESTAPCTGAGAGGGATPRAGAGLGTLFDGLPSPPDSEPGRSSPSLGAGWLPRASRTRRVAPADDVPFVGSTNDGSAETGVPGAATPNDAVKFRGS